MSEEKEKYVASEEDKDLVMKGIRPKKMPFDMYKQVRKNLKKLIKDYKKGRFLFISKETKVEEYEEDIVYTKEELENLTKEETDDLPKTRKKKKTVTYSYGNYVKPKKDA